LSFPYNILRYYFNLIVSLFAHIATIRVGTLHHYAQKYFTKTPVAIIQNHVTCGINVLAYFTVNHQFDIDYNLSLFSGLTLEEKTGSISWNARNLKNCLL